jgi:putative addiction module component (TIGR02574 family)
MSAETQHVLASARALSTAAQVELIEALIAGLDEADPEPLDDDTIAEIQRRSADFDAGRVQPIPWAEVRDRVRRGESSGG